MNLHTNKISNSAITTIGGFDYLESFISRIKRLDSSLYLFRGQKNQEWNLSSTSHRKLNKNGGATNLHEDVIKDNVDLISDYKLFGHGQDNQNITTTATTSSDLMILAKLRHLGAASLLLDFTANALVALWFACEEAIDPDENGKGTANSRHLKHKAKNKDGAVFLLPVEDAGKYFPLSKFDQVESFNLQESLSKDTAYYWKAALLSQRIIAQNSYFVIGTEIPFDENTGKIIVPASQKQS
ncbi:MAG: FRG domain-containing protein, partial [Gammaproteobacteria bacterium]|nr:FRG domain-containing protein [Gammaproteobacteria bacterium]